MLVHPLPPSLPRGHFKVNYDTAIPTFYSAFIAIGTSSNGSIRFVLVRLGHFYDPTIGEAFAAVRPCNEIINPSNAVSTSSLREIL
jgi:hypothetical protein